MLWTMSVSSPENHALWETYVVKIHLNEILMSVHNIYFMKKDKKLSLNYNLSLVVRKLVLGVSDKVRHKPGCTATEDG